MDRDALIWGGAAVCGAGLAWYLWRRHMPFDFTDPPEDYAPSEPVRKCDPTPKPGVMAFRDWWMGKHRGADWGISRECVGPSQGGNGVPTSPHHEGRAWDWHPPSRHAADSAIEELLANDAELARRAGIRVIIYWGRIWNAGRVAAGLEGWARYKHAGSPDPTLAHRDHVHFAFSWAGACGETSLQRQMGWRASVPALPLWRPPDELGNVLTIHDAPDQLDGPHDDAGARIVLLAAYARRGHTPTLSELQIAQAIGRFEGGYGYGWKDEGIGSHNWGAIQCASRAPCPEGCFQNRDSDAAGTPYEGCFRRYASPLDGASDLLHQLYRREGVEQAMVVGDATRVAERMRATRYFEAPADRYAKAIYAHAGAVASSLGEDRAVELHRGAGTGGSAGALAVLVLAAGALAAASGAL